MESSSVVQSSLNRRMPSVFADGGWPHSSVERNRGATGRRVYPRGGTLWRRKPDGLGWISAEGKTDLLILGGGVTAQVYIDQVLHPVVVPYAAAVGDGFFLMQDNARPHTAAITTEFLETEGIETLDWPAKSPDLNPIEHLWDSMKKKVNKSIKPDTTLEGLRRILIRKWQGIDQGQIRGLIESMRRRILAVQDSDGGHTKY